jgi:hypothetical protein
MLKARRVQTWAHPGLPLTLLTGGLPHFVPVSQKMAGHASASTTAGYDRRDRGVQRRAAVLLQVPYTVPED